MRLNDPFPLLSVPSHLHCSSDVHVPLFQIFLYIVTVYPCFWLCTSRPIPFAFDTVTHQSRYSIIIHFLTWPTISIFSLDLVTCCFCLLELTSITSSFSSLCSLETPNKLELLHFLLHRIIFKVMSLSANS